MGLRGLPLAPCLIMDSNPARMQPSGKHVAVKGQNQGNELECRLLQSILGSSKFSIMIVRVLIKL